MHLHGGEPCLSLHPHGSPVGHAWLAMLWLQQVPVSVGLAVAAADHVLWHPLLALHWLQQ